MSAVEATRSTATTIRKKYWFRDEHDEACASVSRTHSETVTPLLLPHNKLPEDMMKIIKAASADVFGIASPREFQYVGAYHCMFNDDTVLAIPQKTTSGKTLIVQIASWF